MLSLDAKIESILFYKGEPVSHKELASILKVDIAQVKEAITVLRDRVSNIGMNGASGLSIIENGDEVGLFTTPEASDLIENLRKDELSKELSKAALETLSIIMYGKDVSRSDIDYIRGVNSSFIIRNLLIRGLVEKKDNSNDLRKNMYVPTLALLSYMGVSELSELPDFEQIRAKLTDSKEQVSEGNA